MEARLISLKLVLDALGVDAAIGKLSDRKLLQKAIYLGQAGGADLGYSYGWYIRGPYSRKLTKDYYGLAETIEEEDKAYERYVLVPDLADRLAKMRPVMEVPEGVDLEQHDWLELLASLHFLLENRGLQYADAKDVLAEKKSHLVAFIDTARDVLRGRQLIAA